MTVQANCQYDQLVATIGTLWGKSNNQVFDTLVLQAAQRLCGNPLQFDAAGVGGNTATITPQYGANGSVFTVPGNPAVTTVRGGFGND